MVMKALQQLLHEVEWGGLDILVLDLPPGTGDTQLTITQQINLDGEKTLPKLPLFALHTERSSPLVKRVTHSQHTQAPSSYPPRKTLHSKTL